MVFTSEKFTGEIRGKEREKLARKEQQTRDHSKQKGGKRR